MQNNPPSRHEDGEAMPDYLTPGEVAAWLRVSVRTVRRWISSGILKASQPNPRPGSRRWIAKADLLRLLDSN